MKLSKGSLSRGLLTGILIFLLSFSMKGTGIAKAELTKIRVGMCPYPMFVLWLPAHEFGIDKEFGLDFEITEFVMTLPATQAMIHGDVDIVPSCHNEQIAAMAKATQLQQLSTLGYFKGFIFVGRKGEWKPFDELVAEMGLKKAKETRLKEFKGKAFVGIPQRKPLVADTIAQVGFTLKDIRLLKFADDQKGATAFIKGAGDVSIGGLPQALRLLDMPDQFVNLGGHRILGPAGLWYDTVITTKKYLEENRETCLRAVAAMYRTIRLFDEFPEKVGVSASKALSRMTGGKFSIETWIEMQTVYDDFVSIEEGLAGYYNPASDLYWRHTVSYNLEMAKEEGDLDETVSIEDNFSLHEELFWELLTRKDLLQLIYAPFSF